MRWPFTRTKRPQEPQEPTHKAVAVRTSYCGHPLKIYVQSGRPHGVIYQFNRDTITIDGQPIPKEELERGWVDADDYRRD